MSTPQTATPPRDRPAGGHRRPSRVTIAVLGAALALATAAGCKAADKPAASSTPAPAVTVTDPWVKTAASGMTAAFGMLTNNTDHEVTVVSGSTPASSKVELHEVTMVDGKMVMRPKAGGFVIPAHGTHELKAGSDHIMLLDVTAPVKPGDQVPFTLTLSDGSTVRFTAVAKDFAGGNESYKPGMQMSPSPSASAHG